MTTVANPSIRISINTEEISSKVRSMTDHISNSVKRSTTGMTAHYRSALGSLSKTIGSVSGIFTKSLRSMNMIFFELFGASAVHSIFNMINAFASLNNVLLTVSDNATEAQQQFEFLRDSSRELGFDITRMAAAYNKFYAAGKVAGFTTEKLQETFGALSETARVVNMDSAQLEGALRALHQMMSKGKVQAEELRGQLGEHLPGAFELAAKAMGVTTGELDKMLSQGKVTAKALLENFPQALRDTYGPGLATAIRTPRSELERLKTDVALFIKELGPEIDTLVFEVLSSIRTLTSSFSTDTTDSIKRAFRAITVTIKMLPDILGGALVVAKERFKPLIEGAKLAVEGIAIAFNWLLNFFKSDIGEEIVSFWGWAMWNLPSIVAGAVKSVGVIFGGMVDWLILDMKRLQDTNSYRIEMVVNAFKLFGTNIQIFFAKINGAVTKSFDSASKNVTGFLSSIVPVLETVNEGLAAKVKTALTVMDQATTNMVNGSEARVKALEAEAAGYSTAMDQASSMIDDINRAAGEELEIIKRTVGEMLSEITTGVAQNAEALDETTKSYVGDLQLAWEHYMNILDANEMLLELNQQNASGIETMNKGLKEMSDLWKDITKNAVDIISNQLTDAWVQFAETGKIEFRDMVNSMLSDLNRMLFQKLIAEQLVNAAASGIAGMFGVAYTPAAKGAIVSHAQGSVVSTSSYFAAGGAMNVAGEAGAEGILPLARTKSGDLGVQSVGGSGSNVTVNIYNQAGDDTETSTSERKGPNGEKILDVMIKRSVNAGIGTGAFDKALASSFGIKRGGY